MKLSIIIPAHNEEKRIEITLKDYASFFQKKYKNNFEIIVVLNGCRDNTLDVVRKMKRKYSRIKYLSFAQSGKGFAILEGFKSASGELIGFTDADDSTTAREFNKLIEKIGNFDGIIASRWIKGSVVQPKQPFTRIIASRAFNMLVRILFGLNVYDTQCGAKLFRKDALKKAMLNIGIADWAFDIDLLYQLKKNNSRMLEIPITWKDSKGSKLNIAKTSLQMLLAILRLRLIYSPFSFMIRFYDKFKIINFREMLR